MDMYLADFWNYGITNRSKSTEIETVVAEIEEMKLSDKDIIYNYETLHSSPWAPHIDFEERHRKITEVTETLYWEFSAAEDSVIWLRLGLSAENSAFLLRIQPFSWDFSFVGEFSAFHLIFQFSGDIFVS